MRGGELKQLVVGRSHTAGHTLDEIYSNNPNLTCTAVLPLPWTDHSAILFELAQLTYPQVKQKPKDKIAIRVWKNINITDLGTTQSNYSQSARGN